MSESTKNMTEPPKLKFDRIDISFIYGYVNYNLRKSVVNKNEIKGFDEMWAPIYNLNRLDDGFGIQNLLDSETIPITITSDSGENISANLSASILRKRYKLEEGSKKEEKGGPGCVTIKISVERPAEKSFDIGTIFKILELIPRKSKDSEFRKEIKFINKKIKSQEGEKLEKFSPVFRLFYKLLRENQECWNELYPPNNPGCPNLSDCGHCKEYYPFYDENSDTDPQIPYIIVEGYLFKKDYDRDFIYNNEDNKDEKKHSKYTNEIGCLLGRWLNLDNIDHLNTDYYRYYTDNDELIGKMNGTFVSRYRDKKSFIVFSSLLTLILKCKHLDENTVE